MTRINFLLTISSKRLYFHQYTRQASALLGKLKCGGFFYEEGK